MTDKYVRDEEVISRLDRRQFDVTQRGATEPAFANAYWDNEEAGLYVDVVSGEPLFVSTDKYDSGCGWPSFTSPLDKDRVIEKKDRRYLMVRTEVRSARGDSHLGHVFADGPGERGGLRYCINSAALRFIAYENLDDEGYGEFRDRFDVQTGEREVDR